MPLTAVTRPLRLFLVRHGETDYNAAGIVQGGGIDAPLNAKGRAQAEAFHRYWQHHRFEGLVCSALQRTYQTLAPFAEQTGTAPLQLAGLNEIGWGLLEGQTHTPETVAAFQRTTEAWKRGELDYHTPGGESPRAVWARAQAALQTLIAQYPAGGDLLVCTHGRTLRILLAELMGYGLAQMERFSHQNTALNILMRIQPELYVAECLNDTRHLQYPEGAYDHEAPQPQRP